MPKFNAKKITIGDWLATTSRQLENAGISTSRLDCLVLLEDVFGKDKSWILANTNIYLQIENLSKLNTIIAQRLKHVPLAYLRGKSEFYGRDFLVNTHVLEPRPETEAMIELVKMLVLTNKSVFVDVGTGSGCIAITVKLELPMHDVYGLDIDPACLFVSNKNSKNLQATVTFLESDLLSVVVDDPFMENAVILCNLPYVPENYTINQAATHEPRLALFGGIDGLDLYRRLFAQITALINKPVFILTESLPSQHKLLAEIAKVAGYSLEKTDDFMQLFKLA